MLPKLSKVYAGFVIPVMVEEGKVTHVVEAPINDYIALINLLGDELRNYAQYVLKCLNAKSPNELDLKKLITYLEQLSNYIVGFFKLANAPITIPPKKGAKVIARAPPSPQEILWLWVLTKVDGRFKGIWYGKDLLGVLSDLEGIYGALEKDKEPIISLIMPSLHIKDFERRVNVVLRIPADTRPGPNTSKLIPHTFAVSAISVAKYLSRVKGKELDIIKLEKEILRLACLLHDIGKPIAWREGKVHTEVSRDIAKDWLSGLLPDDVLDVVLELIEMHHNPDNLPNVKKVLGIVIDVKFLGRIIRESDIDASAVDRLVDLVTECLKDKLSELGIDENKLKEYLTYGREDAWAFWFNLGPEKTKELTNYVCEKLSKIASVLAKRFTPREVSDVHVVSIDVRGVQSFISRENLRMLTASSLVIDLFTIYVVSRALIELNIPPESIIYAGGAFAIAITPSTVSENEIYEAIGKVSEKVLSKDVEIGHILVKEQLYVDWWYTANNLASALSAKKKETYSTQPSFNLGIVVPCEFCRRRPATLTIRNARVCKECERLWRLGSDLYITFRLRRLGNLGYDVSEELNEDKTGRLMERLIEWFSGHKRWEERGGEVAIVKADGNAIGKFMGTSLTLTDAMERSLRVDFGLKLGLFKLFTELVKCGEALKRVFTGLMYAGGDDLLAIWPSYIAIPAALYVAYWFWWMVGGVTQLSIGVAVGKPKHNIWALLNTSNFLLNKSKSVPRTLRLSNPDILGSVIASISFLHSEQQLFESDADYMLRTYGSKKLSLQPYLLTTPNIVPKLRDVYQGIFNDLSDVIVGNQSKAINYLNELLKYSLNLVCAKDSKEKERKYAEVSEFLKNLRRVVMDVSNVINKLAMADYRDMMLVTHTYLTREFMRLKEVEGVEPKRIEVLEKLCRTYVNAGILPPLFDLFILSKTLMGGIV